MAARTSSALDDGACPLGLAPRTVFVTGKGGVGKSTVAAALALAWRDAGARTLLVGIDEQSAAAGMLTNRTVGYDATPVGKHLAALRITMHEALREYARMRLKLKLVADRLVDNPVIDQFAQAAPGFRDLLVLGKLWSLATERDESGRPRWDAIIVDSPATGHGLGMLGMAGVIARMFPVGPIATDAQRVDAFVRDADQVGVVLVSLPEELPVTETLELHDALAARQISVAATVLNGVLVDRFTDDESRQASVAARDSTTGLPAHVRHALEAAAWEHERCVDQATERQRLERGLDDDVHLLPFMFVPELEGDHIAALARWLTLPGQDVLQQQLAGAANGPAAAAAVHAAGGSR